MSYADQTRIVPLSVEEAVHAIVTGDHPEASDQIDPMVDLALIDLLQDGRIVAVRDTVTRKLGFKVTGDGC